jgi:hypothetical protein
MHAGEFGFVASVIGLIDFPRPETLPEGQNYHVPTEHFTDDAVTWERLNPLRSIEKLQGNAITLVLATRGFERAMNENFLAALRAKQIPARVHWLEGGHEFSLVEKALPIVFSDAAAFFGGRPLVLSPSSD